MKLSFLFVPLGLASMLMSGAVIAAGQGSGKVTFTGSIINAACSISPESIDQTVDLGEIAIKDLIDADKKSTARNFDITLENCVLDDETAANTVSVVFSGQGANFNPEILGITGTASGAGVAIAEQNSGDGYLPLGSESSKLNLVAG
ncbi:fimbrial protein, partial [Enterobacter kobei]